jgi:excisionase family DNA binding protein
MFVTVHEAAFLLDCTKRHVFYLLDMSELDCYRLRSSVRVPLWEVLEYAKRDSAGKLDGASAGHLFDKRYNEFLENLAADAVPPDSARGLAGLQRGRRQGLERAAGGFNRVSRKRRLDDVSQLWLFDFDFCA